MPRQLTAHYSGEGTLEREIPDAKQALIIAYDLDEFQEMIPAPDMENPHGTVLGLKNVRGRLFNFKKGEDITVPPAAGTTWTLNFNDGRRIKFIVERILNFQSVEVCSTGGFF